MTFTINTDNDCDNCNDEIRQLIKKMNMMKDDDILTITIERDRRDLDQYHIVGSKWS